MDEDDKQQVVAFFDSTHSSEYSPQSGQITDNLQHPVALAEAAVSENDGIADYDGCRGHAWTSRCSVSSRDVLPILLMEPEVPPRSCCLDAGLPLECRLLGQVYRRAHCG